MTTDELIKQLQATTDGSKQAALPKNLFVCSHCGRVYDEKLGEITNDEIYSVLDGGPCPSDDCPGHDGERE